MQRWWNKELAFLQFTKNPWWRFAIWGIAFVIIAYCVSDYFIRRYDPNRILPVAPESSNSSYIPSTSPQQQEYNTQLDSVAKVQATVDNDMNPPKQTAVQPQRKEPATTSRDRVDVSAPPIQVGVHSKQAAAEFEQVDWSKFSPKLRAKMKQLDNAPMKLQRIQTPNGKVHFIELPAGVDYNEVDITVSEDIAKTPTFPPTGLFDEIVSVQKSDIPEGEDVKSYLYKKRWASSLDVSVEEVGRMMERGHLPPRPHITERTPVIEFPIEAFIGDEDQPRSGGGVDNSLLSGEHRAAVPMSVGGNAEDIRGAPVRSDMPQGVKPAPQDMANIEKQLTPQGIESEFTEGLSTDPADKAQKLIDRYGTAEGLRRLREVDPEAARRFDRERLRSESPRSSEPSRNAPDGGGAER